MSIGLYYRLSLADGDIGVDDKEESNSIENQRLLLTSFVASRNDLIGEIKEYIDDGFSGTNFDRPAFKRMIEDAKKGVIHTIIVKDLSRLGRDYIGVGDYLEQIFPTLGIRFIAVNSMYDSNDFMGKTVGLDVSITNLVNTLYSKLALFQSLILSLKEEAESRKENCASVNELSTSIETLKAKRIHLYEAYADGTIPKSSYLEQKQEYTGKIEELEAKRAALLALNTEDGELIDAVETLADKANQISICRDLTQEIADEFIDSVIIYDPKHIEVKFTFDDLLQKAANKVTEIQKERVSA